MDHEPGREPTEPTDAELLAYVAQLNSITAQANQQLDAGGWRCDWSIPMNEISAKIDSYLSGQRPMPGSEVSRAEALRTSTDTLLRAEAERLPNTPAPDEVAQLHGGMCPQIVAGNFIVQCNGIVRDKAGVLLFQLEDYAPLTARVAVLEAELEMVKADKISVWAALLATGKVIEEELMRLAGPEPGVEMVGGPTHTAPGKEPTSE